MTAPQELPVSHYGWMRLRFDMVNHEVWERPDGRQIHCPPGCTLTIYADNLLCRRVVPEHGTERLLFVIPLGEPT